MRFPSCSLEPLAGFGFPITELSTLSRVRHPEFPFQVRKVRNWSSPSRFILELADEHGLGYGASVETVFRPLRVDVDRPRWQRSVFRWWQGAVFRAEQLSAAKAASEAVVENAKRETFAKLGDVTYSEFSRVFELRITDIDGVADIRIGIGRWANFREPDDWATMTLDEKIASALRVVRFLREEGFIPRSVEPA